MLDLAFLAEKLGVLFQHGRNMGLASLEQFQCFRKLGLLGEGEGQGTTKSARCDPVVCLVTDRKGLAKRGLRLGETPKL